MSATESVLYYILMDSQDQWAPDIHVLLTSEEKPEQKSNHVVLLLELTPRKEPYEHNVITI